MGKTGCEPGLFCFGAEILHEFEKSLVGRPRAWINILLCFCKQEKLMRCKGYKYFVLCREKWEVMRYGKWS